MARGRRPFRRAGAGVAAAADGFPHHRAGSRHGAVPRNGAADRARSLRSVMAAQRAVREQKPVGIVMQRDPGVDDPLPVDLHRMGTVANIVRYITAPDGTHHLVCQGAAVPPSTI